jgi:hypothetical protein
LDDPAHEGAKDVGQETRKNQTDVNTPRKYFVPVCFTEQVSLLLLNSVVFAKNKRQEHHIVVIKEKDKHN